MSRHSSLRASDADREAIAERLHRAAVEGRLEAEELEDRLHTALRARTYGELGRLVADLPRDRDRHPVRRRSGGLALTAAVLRVIVLLVVVAAVLAAAAFTAAWWLLSAVLWLTIRARHRPRPHVARFASHR